MKWDRHIQHAVNAGGTDPIWHARWVLRALAVLVSPAVDWTKVVTSHRVHGLLPCVKAIGVLAAIRCYRAYKMISLLLSRKQVRSESGGYGCQSR